MYVSYAVLSGLDGLYVLTQASALLRPGLFHAGPSGLTKSAFFRKN
ncbi:MAG: hypothetical protein H0W88_10975 [Parachlamydiaceae bacterium]|nr:hypothetical protein [Parachlamydiaceae bacterium]